MNRTKSFFLLGLLAAVSLTACSGAPHVVCTVNCGNVGNATLTVTLQAKPLALPPNTNILSYSLTVGGVTLTPASGNPINLPGIFTYDMTRLQSDSAFLGSVSVPAGTYTSMTLSLIAASVTYCTATAGVPGCNVGAQNENFVLGGAAAPPLTFAGGGLTLTSNQQAGVSIYFDMGGTLTVANQKVSAVTLKNANLTAITLGTNHPSSLTASQLDYLEDVTGSVAVNGNLVTITTANYGAITATADANTFYSPNCVTLGLATTIACVQANQVASINAILDADGTIKLISYDPISAASASNNDWIEGIVPYAGINLVSFNIVANDADISTSNTLLPKPFPISSLITVNLKNGAVFSVDTQGLNVPADYTKFQGTPDATVLLPGQTVAVHVTTFGLAGGLPGGIVVTADAVELRFTRVAGSAAANGTNASFAQTSSSLPLYFGFTNVRQLVELTTGVPPAANSTFYDGVTAPTNITAAATYSIRALYFGQSDAFPFVAAKVRQNP
jgi:hypothetical protein